MEVAQSKMIKRKRLRVCKKDKVKKVLLEEDCGLNFSMKKPQESIEVVNKELLLEQHNKSEKSKISYSITQSPAPAKLSNLTHSNSPSILTPNKSSYCKCTNSKCIKSYCPCYHSSKGCSDKCNCINCENKQFNINKSLKIKTRNEIICNCITSKCLKGYCECYKAGIKCGDLCRCCDCLNMNDNLGERNEGKVRTSNYRTQLNLSKFSINKEEFANVNNERNQMLFDVKKNESNDS